MDDYLLRKNFFQLKRFIEGCLGRHDYLDEKDKDYLTTDYHSLIELADRLSILLDKPLLGMVIPRFNQWTLPLDIGVEALRRFNHLENRRYEEYLHHKEEYEEILREAKITLGTGRKIMSEIYSKIERASHDKVPNQVMKLPWKILPPDAGVEERFSQIIDHYSHLEKVSGERYDLDRLRKIYGLKPDEIYIGIDEFQGYIVFYFKRIESAILECPVTGNAIYVFQKNWLALSKLSKAALLGQEKGNVQRIVHNGSWFSRLEWLIRTREEAKALRSGIR